MKPYFNYFHCKKSLTVNPVQSASRVLNAYINYLKLTSNFLKRYFLGEGLNSFFSH